MKIVKKADLGKEKTFNREIQDLEHQVLIAERERDLAKGRLSGAERVNILVIIMNIKSTRKWKNLINFLKI